VVPRSRLLLALAGALLMAACASAPGPTSEQDGATPAAEPRAGTTAPASSAEATTLPLDAFVPTAEQWEVLNRASGLLEQDCMRRLGFANWQPPDPKVTGGRPPMFPFGIVDAQQAAKHGYHDPRVAEINHQQRQRPRLNAQQQAQERAELAALTGDSSFATLPGRQVPPDGCSGEAERKLRTGAPEFDVNLYGELITEADQRAVADGRVRAVIEAWSACMKRTGFDYGSPLELAQPEGNQWSTPAPTRVEIATARADVACKQQTDLPRVWLAVVAGYQRQLIEQHRLGLDQMSKELEYRIRRANDTLQGHQG
jgi:hypothetical protein